MLKSVALDSKHVGVSAEDGWIVHVRRICPRDTAQRCSGDGDNDADGNEDSGGILKHRSRRQS